MAADTTKPVLTSLVLPKTVNLSKGNGAVKATVGATDTGSGIANVFIGFDRGYQSTLGLRSFLYLDGDEDSFADGKSSTSTIFTKDTYSGVLNVSYVSITDKAGNSAFYFGSDLARLGLQTSVTITGSKTDTTKPTLTALALPAKIDLSKGSVSVSASVGAADVGSGVASVFVTLDRSYQSPNGPRSYFSLLDSQDSFADGRSSITDIVTKATAAGTYGISSVTVADKAGNASFYTKSDLARLGFQTSVTVVKAPITPDKTKPVLTSLDLPKVINLSAGDAIVTATVGARDTGSGIDHVFVDLDRPYQSKDGPKTSFTLYDRDDSFSDGKSSAIDIVAKTTATGVYGVKSVTVADKAGNLSVYTKSDLARLGFQTSVTVTSTKADPVKPTLTALVLPQTIDLTKGSVTIKATAGAKDKGSGVEAVFAEFQHNSDSIRFRFEDSKDSFSDGKSSLTQTIDKGIDPGIYNVTSIVVRDYAGNYSQYFEKDLAKIGIKTSITIKDPTKILGDFGDDTLRGTSHADHIDGYFGDDILDGKGGADTLKGHAGADTFVFSTPLGSGNVDHIVDYSTDDIGIKLAKSVFTLLAPGKLSASAFKNFSAPGAKVDADDRIVYKQATGELFYDADGSGKGAGVLFAILDNKASLTHADILVV